MSLSGRNKIVAMDLGSNKVAAAVAVIEKSGEISILATENLYSRGISGGEITDINKAVEDVSSIMGKLQGSAKKKIRRLFVTTKGSDIRMDASRGIIPLSKSSREINSNDLKRCLEIAGMIKLPIDRVLIQKIIKGFYVDDARTSINNPVGLYGIKLEAEAFIATANQSKIQNITKCIDHAGFLLEGIFLSSVSSANAVLGDEEKERGVLLLDIGDVLTEELIFKRGTLRSYRVINKGASGVSGQKERGALLQKLGSAFCPAENEEISQIVVTGGGALLEGLIEEAEKVFKKPARIGIVQNAATSLSPQDAIIHTSTIGLLNQIAKEYKSCYARKNPLQKAFCRILRLYETYF